MTLGRAPLRVRVTSNRFATFAQCSLLTQSLPNFGTATSDVQGHERPHAGQQNSEPLCHRNTPEAERKPIRVCVILFSKSKPEPGGYRSNDNRHWTTAIHIRPRWHGGRVAARCASAAACDAGGRID